MNHGGNVWQGDNPAQWLDYSANIRPEGAPDWVKKALMRGMDNLAWYPDPDMKRATAAMARYLGIAPEYMRPTAGGISAIQLANRVPSRETAIFTPCFCEYEQFARSPVRKISLLREKHTISLPSAPQLAPESLVWLCNPLNPTGTAFSLRQIASLLARVEEANGYLAVDEAFIEYCPRHSALSLLEKHDRLLITGSMTKILGVPGVRLGYLCAHPRVLKALKKFQLTWELSCFAEAVACALPEHMGEIRADGERNQARRAQMKDALEAMGIFVYPGEAAFLLADFGRNVKPIIQHLKKKNILVRSCLNFGGIDDGCHLRLAVKDEASNERFIFALREAMQCAENL